MENCREDVTVQHLEDQLQEIRGPQGEMSDPEWKRCFEKTMNILEEWFQVAKHELQFLGTCIQELPDSPPLLYALAPPQEALPQFYPALYPYTTEPLDAEDYAKNSENGKNRCKIMQRR